MKCLITGSNSGLGKYLHRQMGGCGFSRGTPFAVLADQSWDCIIHCAFNSQKQMPADALGSYFQDNLFLTKQLAVLPSKKIIFLSSVEVYPQTGKAHHEEEVIQCDVSHNVYALAKLAAETLIQQYHPNSLILRAGALLGLDSRPNSLIKILTQPHCTLPLSAHSRFYYVLHSDLLRLIQSAIASELQGIYNVVTNETITLGEAAKMFHKPIDFGPFTYTTDSVNNKKIKQIDLAFNISSREVVEKFAGIL